MNEFTRKPIEPQNRPPSSRSSLLRKIIRTIPTNKTEYQQKKIPFFFLIITFTLAAYIIFRVVFTVYEYIVYFDMSDLVGIVSSDLQKDDKNRTNILVLGNGGEGHDGSDLTDTIIVASINGDNNTASLLSLPRDLWLDLPGYESSRINKIYDLLKDKYGSTQALDILRSGIENITNVEIPYYIKIDFQGFVKVVDALGGIDILVEKSIYDEEYPREDESGYEVFSIEAGLQHLDGATALKYARSRHSTSDFDRAARQHQIINAVKEKAKETSFLTSPLLLRKLYSEYKEHIETNLKTTEMISLANLGRNFQDENITSAVLIDNDILDVGSFLYTPERALYGGAFVLVPQGNSFEKIQRFISLVFDHPGFFHENASVQILNGTNRYGIAAQLGTKIIPYGFNIQQYGNADQKNYSSTHYYIHHPEKTQATEGVLQLFFPKALKMRNNPPEGISTDYDISIVIGQDLDLKDL